MVGRRGRRAHPQSIGALPGAKDIEPDWTLEAAADPHRVVQDPDPKSRAAYIRIVGYSPGAGFMVTVIVDQRTGPASLQGRRAAGISVCISKGRSLAHDRDNEWGPSRAPGPAR